METFVQQYCQLKGYAAHFINAVQSSDSAPFCDHNIPAIGLSRGTRSAEIHTVHDLIEILDETALAKNIQFAIQLVKDLAEAAVLPFPCRVPQDKKTELDRYSGRLNTSASALKA